MSRVDRKLRVFLCHSSKDKAIVRELYQQLMAEEWIDPWFDEEQLLPGQDWDIAIEKAAESADVVIVCLSNNSVNGEGYVQREIRFVLDIALTKPEETIFIIPLRLEDCQPPRRLRVWQYADYFPAESRQKSYQRLQQSLKVRLDQRFPQGANVPGKSSQRPKIQKTIEESPFYSKEKKTVKSNPTTATIGKSDSPLSTISIETLGGVSTPVYYKDDPLPFRTSMVFSTATDDQKQVEIHLVLGENSVAKDNVSLGKFVFDGISPAPKGVPQIEIQIDISTELILNVKAVNQSTKQSKDFPSVTLIGLVPPAITQPLPPKSAPNYQGDFSDIFEELFGQFGFSQSRPQRKRTRDINLDLTISPSEAMFGTTKEVEYQREDVCSTCNGTRIKPGTMIPSQCTTCQGKGEVRAVKQTFLGSMVQTSECPACKGSGEIISSPCQICHGKGNVSRRHHVNVSIKSNTQAGKVIKLPGVGNIKSNDGSRSDVFIRILVEQK